MQHMYLGAKRLDICTYGYHDLDGRCQWKPETTEHYPCLESSLQSICAPMLQSENIASGERTSFIIFTELTFPFAKLKDHEMGNVFVTLTSQCSAFLSKA